MNTKYTFTGQYTHVDDFGLLFYVARWYDPTLSRFAQADTVGAGDRYAYVNNNPVRYNDPTGHCVDPDNCQSNNGDQDQSEEEENNSDADNQDPNLPEGNGTICEQVEPNCVPIAEGYLSVDMIDLYLSMLNKDQSFEEDFGYPVGIVGLLVTAFWQGPIGKGVGIGVAIFGGAVAYDATKLGHLKDYLTAMRDAADNNENDMVKVSVYKVSEPNSDPFNSSHLYYEGAKDAYTTPFLSVLPHTYISDIANDLFP
ncbi:MAG: RHS repeat-associated core domain-containing protein [Anaerolineales bacterium]|nr:RHS repeat-associated core domain-containing protein [Anaerolineales bacterium]